MKFAYDRKSFACGHKTDTKPVPLQIMPARSANDATWCGELWRTMAENIGIMVGVAWRKMADFVGDVAGFVAVLLVIPSNALSRLWRFMAVFVGNMVDYDAVWCGGKWRILSTNILYMYHSPRRIS